MGLSYAFILNKSTNNTHGAYPVYFRVTLNGKNRYKTLSIWATPDEYDEDLQQFTKKHKNQKQDNSLLAAYKSKADDYLDMVKKQKVSYSFDGFKDYVFGGGLNQVGLADIAMSMAKSKTSPGTSDKYKVLSNNIQRYKKKALVSDVTTAWIEGFERHLRTDGNCTDGGVSGTMAILKSVIRQAKKDGYSAGVGNPFDGYKIGKKKTNQDVLRLSLLEVIAIKTCKNLKPSESYYRDLFIFSFNARGMNMADIALLKHAHIENDRIVYSRKKVKVSNLSVPITDEMREILEKYKEFDKTHCFPILQGATSLRDIHKKTNNASAAASRLLRIVAEKAGVKRHDEVTFYTARHSYANILRRDNVSIEIISQALGHKNISTTQIYLSQFDDSVIDEIDNKIRNGKRD